MPRFIPKRAGLEVCLPQEVNTPERHPLNRSFEWRSTQGPGRLLSASQARAFDSEGYFVLEEAFDADTMKRAIEEIDPVEANVESLLRAQPDGRLFIARAGEITFSPHLVTRSPWLRDFVRHPVFQGLVGDLLGDDVRLYWDQAVYKKPGTEAPFPWHQDNAYTFVEPQQYLTCWLALSDTDLDNGCPWVLPGLHRHGTLLHQMTELGWSCCEDPEGAVALPLRAGSIAVFSSLTPHRTGPNRSAEIRKSYIVQFAPEGAHVLMPDAEGGDLREERCDAPERQFPILVGGRPA